MHKTPGPRTFLSGFQFSFSGTTHCILGVPHHSAVNLHLVGFFVIWLHQVLLKACGIFGLAYGT